MKLYKEINNNDNIVTHPCRVKCKMIVSINRCGFLFVLATPQQAITNTHTKMYPISPRGKWEATERLMKMNFEGQRKLQKSEP